MEIKTIIFDLDGTLLNTLGDLKEAINYALTQYSYPERTEKEIKSFIGNGIKAAIEKAVNQKISDEKLTKIINTFKDYYKEHSYEQTKPYDGIKEVLKLLKQKGYKLGVVSNKVDEAVKPLCKYYFEDLIDTAIGEGKGIERKPNPMGVMKVIEELNSKPEESIYIGDSETDTETAKNAKIPCISVLWGYRDKELLEKSGAKIFAEKPEEIIKIIEKKIYLS